MTARDTHRTLKYLSDSCDVVLGGTCVALSLLSTWRWLTGTAPLGLMVAVWTLTVWNSALSVVTKHRDRVPSDLIRGLGSLPITMYIYSVDAGGVFHHMLLLGLMATLGASLSVGIGSRNLWRGAAISLAYVTGIFVVGGFGELVVHDAFGLLVSDAVVSIIAVTLGRALVESTQRRDEAAAQRARAEATLAALAERTEALSRTLTELHDEMERRKQMEAELVQAQKLESVGRLAAGIAHEINTPIQFVSDSVQFVRDAVDDLLALARGEPPEDLDLDYLSDEVPGALTRADDGLQRVTRIVRSMKLFAHPPSIERTPADLNAAIDATLVVAHNEYAYVAELVTDLDPGLPPVSCFLSELNQAVLNIVVNAAHAIGDSVAGTAARGTIEVSTRRDGGDAVIAIRDTGVGIPDAIRDRVFDPFFTTKVVGKGTGQGLAIAHAVVVDKHRGRLWFDTETGRGTTFYLRIPIAPRSIPEALPQA